MNLGIVADRMLELLESEVDPECLETLDPADVPPGEETQALSTQFALAVAVGRILEPRDLKWNVRYGRDPDTGLVGVYLRARGVHYLLAC